MTLDTNLTSSIDQENDRYKTHLLLIDLRRLLERMEKYNPDSLNSYTLRGRASMAMDLLKQLPLADETLHKRVHETCRKAEELATQRSESEIDWVDEIFFKPANKNVQNKQLQHNKSRGENDKEENDRIIPGESNLDFQEIRIENQVLSSLTQPIEIQGQDNIVDIQNAQREQLEEEIMHMTEQLKASTQRMNSTIRGHTEHLEAMETLATENLHQIGKATDRIDDYNKKSWNSTLATWTLMIIVFSSFLFCMLIIRTIPKRKNTSLPCLMNCNQDDQSVQQKALAKLEALRQAQMDIEFEAKELHDKVREKNEEILQYREAQDTRNTDEVSEVDNPKESDTCQSRNGNGECIAPQGDGAHSSFQKRDSSNPEEQDPIQPSGENIAILSERMTAENDLISITVSNEGELISGEEVTEGIHAKLEPTRISRQKDDETIRLGEKNTRVDLGNAAVHNSLGDEDTRVHLQEEASIVAAVNEVVHVDIDEIELITESTEQKAIQHAAENESLHFVSEKDDGLVADAEQEVGRITTKEHVPDLGEQGASINLKEKDASKIPAQEDSLTSQIEPILEEGEEAANINSELEEARIAAVQEDSLLVAEQDSSRKPAKQEGDRLISMEEATFVTTEQDFSERVVKQVVANAAAEDARVQIATNNEAAQVAAEIEASRIVAEKVTQGITSSENEEIHMAFEKEAAHVASTTDFSDNEEGGKASVEVASFVKESASIVANQKGPIEKEYTSQTIDFDQPNVVNEESTIHSLERNEDLGKSENNLWDDHHPKVEEVDDSDDFNDHELEDDNYDLAAAILKLRMDAEAARKIIESNFHAQEDHVISSDSDLSMTAGSNDCGVHNACLEDDDKTGSHELDCQGEECTSNDSTTHTNVDISGNIHLAAATNDIRTLRKLLEAQPELATLKDENGWEPMHEAAFRDNLEILDILLYEYRVDVNALTKNGATALWWIRHLPSDHPIVLRLKSEGGEIIGPE